MLTRFNFMLKIFCCWECRRRLLKLMGSLAMMAGQHITVLMGAHIYLMQQLGKPGGREDPTVF